MSCALDAQLVHCPRVLQVAQVAGQFLQIPSEPIVLEFTQEHTPFESTTFEVLLHVRHWLADGPVQEPHEGWQPIQFPVAVSL